VKRHSNVIFLITHDVGAVYGCYGNNEIYSPNIDSLASESVRFDSHYCQWPLCGPSRANLFTGCRPLTTKRFNNLPFFKSFRNRAPEGFVSLPECFARAGSHTFGAGWIYHDDIDNPSWTEGHSIPLPNTDTLPAWAEGWMSPDYLYEWKAESSRALIRSRLEKLKEAGVTPEVFQQPEVFRKARGPAVESAKIDDNQYYDGKVAELACGFLDQYQSDRYPYFLAAGFVAPHTPFRASEKYWNLYNRSELTLHPSREWPLGSDDWMAGDSEPAQYYTTKGYTKPWKPDEDQLRELLHGHYAAISYLDAQVGRILEKARRRDDWDNTIIIFTSDHGFSEGDHGYWGKHNMWDASLHIPLIIRIPEERNVPTAVSRITEHVDVFPSLCDVAGIPIPEFCEGRSFRSLLYNSESEWKDTAISHRRHMWHDRLQKYDQCDSIRTKGYRYSEYKDIGGDVVGAELFDYEKDPLESINHADEECYTSVRNELAKKLKSSLDS